MNKFYFSFFLFFSFSYVAQNVSGVSPIKKKEHYKIINVGNDNPLVFEKVVCTFQGLDSLRFLNERRHIAIEGTSLILELFSAQELFNFYGKPVSILTIKDGSVKRNTKVILSTKNTFETIIK